VYSVYIVCHCVCIVCIEHRQACFGMIALIANSSDLGVEESRSRGLEGENITGCG
jgi:hypothetical protein